MNCLHAVVDKNYKCAICKEVLFELNQYKDIFPYVARTELGRQMAIYLSRRLFADIKDYEIMLKLTKMNCSPKERLEILG